MTPAAMSFARFSPRSSDSCDVAFIATTPVPVQSSPPIAPRQGRPYALRMSRGVLAAVCASMLVTACSEKPPREPREPVLRVLGIQRVALDRKLPFTVDGGVESLDIEWAVLVKAPPMRAAPEPIRYEHLTPWTLTAAGATQVYVVLLPAGAPHTGALWIDSGSPNGPAASAVLSLPVAMKPQSTSIDALRKFMRPDAGVEIGPQRF
jgi:hypothetical protein